MNVTLAPPVPAAPVVSGQPTLCVDLDGTLLRGDLLWEQLLFLLRRRPGLLFSLLLTLWRGGKAGLKTRLAALPMPPFGQEGFDPAVVAWLQEEKSAGRRLHLVTASHAAAAHAAARQVDGLFDAVSTSTPAVSLAGDAKARLLDSLYGPGGWDYAGNARADLAVWRRARRAVAVRVTPGTLRALRRSGHRDVEVFSTLPPRVGTVARALRWPQFIKNVLVFLPLVMAHRLGDAAGLGRCALAFVCFSAAAAAAYCVNDLLDLGTDRLDPRKGRRPFAAGELSPGAGMALAAGLVLGAGALSAVAMPVGFSLALALYFGATLAYSLGIKRMLSADVVVLTGLYTLRIEAGGLAAGVPVSQWLLGFSIFFFLTLSSLKRYGELLAWRGRLGATDFLPGRGYQLRDRETVRALGCASGYLSVLVFILYVSSPAVAALYHRPELLWTGGPLLVYWLNRLWTLAGRGLIPGDPIPFVLRDRVTYVVGSLLAVVLWAAA